MTQDRHDPLRDRSDHQKLIPLREVIMWEPIERPRNLKDAHPSTDKILQRYPASQGKQLLLFMTPDQRFVLAQDPESLEYEEFPITSVRQQQRLTSRHIELANAKPAGSVHRLAGEGPRPPQVQQPRPRDA
jgi:hypothetical protein